MQRITLVRYTTKPGRGDENERLVRNVFAELRSKPQQPFAYAFLRDGDDFLHLFLNLAEDDASGLVELESFKAFSRSGPERWTGQPDVLRRAMGLVQSYGFASNALA